MANELPSVCGPLAAKQSSAYVCKNEMEKTTGKPYHVASEYNGQCDNGGGPVGNCFDYFVREGYIKGCAEEAVYKRSTQVKVGLKDYARQCAESLSNLTKKPHEVKKVDGNFQVVKKTD